MKRLTEPAAKVAKTPSVYNCNKKYLKAVRKTANKLPKENHKTSQNCACNSLTSLCYE